MKTRLFPVYSRLSLPQFIRFGATLGTLVAAQAVDYYKANNTSNLNQNASREDSSGAALATTPVNGTGSSDILIWDNRVTGENVTTMGNNIGVNTIRILAPSCAVTINASNLTFTFTNNGG